MMLLIQWLKNRSHETPWGSLSLIMASEDDLLLLGVYEDLLNKPLSFL
jgi:hypothetical protein